MDSLRVVLLAVATTLVALFAARRAASPSSRREVPYLLGLLGIGVVLCGAMLLVAR
jgi:hypothetical protein